MDEVHRAVFQRLLDERWEDWVATAADFTLAARSCEWFADQAVSVGRRVVSLVTGERAADVAPLAAL